MALSEWLQEPLWGMLRSTLYGGLAVAIMGSLLSVLVVLKRMSFIGQGVSHSAFGGIGVAALAAALSTSVAASWDVVAFAIILGFCIVAALGMAVTSDREAVESDTAIGVFLVASMALGAALVAVAGRMSLSRGGRGGATGAGQWETWLFGSVLGAPREDANVAMVMCAVVVVTLWWMRRPLLFWAFDESGASAFGVRSARTKLIFIFLLALTTVTAMKLAGVVYATALLVLPGAAALRLSARLWPVMLLSVVFSILGFVLGLMTSIAADLPTGASVVLMLTALFVLASMWAWVRRRMNRPPAPAAAPSAG